MKWLQPIGAPGRVWLADEADGRVADTECQKNQTKRGKIPASRDLARAGLRRKQIAHWKLGGQEAYSSVYPPFSFLVTLASKTPFNGVTCGVEGDVISWVTPYCPFYFCGVHLVAGGGSR